MQLKQKAMLSSGLPSGGPSNFCSRHSPANSRGNSGLARNTGGAKIIVRVDSTGSNPYLHAAETANRGAGAEHGRDYVDTNPNVRTPDEKQDPLATTFKLTDTEKGTELKAADRLAFDSVLRNATAESNYQSLQPYVRIPQTQEQPMEHSVDTDRSAPNQHSTFGQVEEGADPRGPQHVTFMAQQESLRPQSVGHSTHITIDHDSHAHRLPPHQRGIDVGTDSEDAERLALREKMMSLGITPSLEPLAVKDGRLLAVNTDLVIVDERSDQHTQRHESKLEKERRILKQKEARYNQEQPLHRLPAFMENGSIERRPSN